MLIYGVVIQSVFVFMSWILCVKPSQDHVSCPVAEPPIDLGTGVLNQLTDVMLKRLFTSQSSILVDQPIKVTDGFEVSQIHVFRLDSIHRTCGIRISSRDKAGCLQRGFLLNACFGFSPLEMNISMKSWIPGLRDGKFNLRIPHISVNAVVELFSSGSPTPLHAPEVLPSSPATENTFNTTFVRKTTYPFARIVQLHVNNWSGVSLRPIQGSWSQRIMTWLINGAANLVKGSVIDRLDWAVRHALNKQLRQLSLHALFTDNTPTKTKTRGLKTKSEQGGNGASGKASRKIPVVPSRIVAIPIL